MDEIERIKEVLSSPLEKAGYELAEVTLSRDKNGLTLHVLVDRDLPISLDDIVEVSNLINPLLDNADPITEPYLLDVSSLGSEKPLHLNRLEHYLHQYVNLHLTHPYQGENILEGELTEVAPDTITLLLTIKTRKRSVVLSRADIDKARLAIRF